MTENDLEFTDIEQDHKKGPGWFLILTYIVVTLFCIYYFVTFKEWKSGYDKQQEEINKKIEGKKSNPQTP